MDIKVEKEMEEKPSEEPREKGKKDDSSSKSSSESAAPPTEQSKDIIENTMEKRFRQTKSSRSKVSRQIKPYSKPFHVPKLEIDDPLTKQQSKHNYEKPKLEIDDPLTNQSNYDDNKGYRTDKDKLAEYDVVVTRLQYADSLANMTSRATTTSHRLEERTRTRTPTPLELERRHQRENVRPGAVAVPGMNSQNCETNLEDGSIIEGSIHEEESENVNHQNEAPMEIANADLVDPDAEEARIRANIVRGAVQATIVPESPRKRFNKRNVTVLFLGIIIILGGIVVALVFAVPLKSNSREEESTPLSLLSKVSNQEELLQDGSPQNLAYSKLLEEAIFNDTPERVFTERYIALVLYFSTNGIEWNDDLGFGQESISVCEWSKENFGGITCNEKDEILYINLEDNNLSGILPSELFQLQSLERLRLRDNQLLGSIPSTFNGIEFDLGNLALLDLAKNSLTGFLPEIFISSKAMRDLDLGSNSLVGTIPDFKSFNGLIKLYLNDNSLTGSIPESISMLSSLTVLNITQNNFSGTIPPGIGKMTSLERMYLNNISVSGSIPYQVRNLENLKAIDYSNNELTGKIPKGLQEIKGLTYLILGNNQLSGSIPSELGLLENLLELDLSRNDITGTFPVELSLLKNLVVIEIDRNNLGGSLDDMFCSGENPFIPTLKADCLGLNPAIECSCCNVCYDNAGNFVEGDSNICSFKILGEIWLKANIKRTAKCECAGRALACNFVSNEPCDSCSADDTRCVRATELSFEEDRLEQAFIIIDFNYTKGLNNTVAVRAATVTSYCEVSVDGKTCESCEIRDCGPNGQRVPVIKCGKIDGVDYKYDGCADVTLASDAGIFSVVQWMISGGIELSEDSCLLPNIFEVSSLL